MSGRGLRDLRAGARRLRFGLSTVLGIRPLGFFIPYRFAASAEPFDYPALEPMFRSAESSARAVLDGAETWADDLRRQGGRARFDQDWFPRLDAVAAYAIVRGNGPRRIVEIGSGHSTRFLAKAVADAGLATEIVAIDPSPRASLDGLRVRHVPMLLGDAHRSLFGDLAASDILFVDSSHIAMPGTDVDRLVGDILPRLSSGVLIHLHDIFLPDAYPAGWRWRGYSESVPVAALLGGGGYDIVFASHWVASRRPEWVETGLLAGLPLLPGARETSLWLRKR